MIGKGTTHNNGARLAHYLITAKEGERAELVELRGFASEDVREAFRSVHVMAEGTHCDQPFFHVQVRNPEGETLTRDQWKYVANRYERMLGLGDQPRAIAFHIDKATGHEHMHIAWSRIDDENMTAKHLPFFKERLKKISRELEVHFDLTPVRNERKSQIEYAPTRAQDEQARRLGVDVHEVHDAIRNCWERSDNGRSFQAALAEQGLTVAQGDRYDFVVIDHAGGLHPLGKRILGVSAAKTRDRMADLDRRELPTAEQARELVSELQRAQIKPEREPVWDRDQHDAAWQDAVINAAIEKEKIERRFVEPERQPQGPLAGGKPDERQRPLPERKGITAQIFTTYTDSNTPQDFAAALEEKAIHLAIVTKDEADRSHREAAFAKAIGNRAPEYREGEIVAITERGFYIYSLNERTTGDDRAGVEKFMATLDRKELQGIEATKQTLHERAALQDIQWNMQTDLWNTGALKRDKDPASSLGSKAIAANNDAAKVIGKTAAKAAKTTSKAVEKLADLADGIMEMLAPTILTPEQKEARAEASEKAAAQQEIDWARYLNENDYRRRMDDQERARREQEQQRDYYQRGRERER